MKNGKEGISILGKGVKKTISKAPLFFFAIIMFVLLVFAVRLRINAEIIGRGIGESTGNMVGKVVGSAEGLTIGYKKGSEAGREKGLSAEDTTVELSGKIKEVQRLQVLVASGTFNDVFSVGENNRYAALLSMRYNAVFTVDLSTAKIELRGDSLYILLNQPEVDFNPVGEIEIIAEYQKNSIKSGAEEGHAALKNSLNQMRDKATEKLVSDMSMMSAARASAEIQLIQLVNAVSLSKPKVVIEFRVLEGGRS